MSFTWVSNMGMDSKPLGHFLLLFSGHDLEAELKVEKQQRILMPIWKSGIQAVA